MHILKNILAMAVVIAMSYSSMVQAQTKTNNNMESVIVYFTYSGNTELAAKQIAKVTGAKMIRLLQNSPIHRKMSIGQMNSPVVLRSTLTNRSVRQSNR